jgi:tRNA pseudouridine38-40 synthase
VRTIRLVVSYDGTDFHGWQVQPGQRTVQGVLEEAVQGVLNDETIRLHGAGRTDAGVHARGQVASLESATRIPVEGLRRALNTRLPDDVRVRAAADAPTGFHARHSACARHYTYRLLSEEDVLMRRIAWHPRVALDPAALEAAVRPLTGEHDFSSFRASGAVDTNPRCRVSAVGWAAWPGGLQLDVTADHFLYHMVRNLVGTALAAAAAPDPAGAMARVMAARDRRAAGLTAPAQGLCLERVHYPEDPS